MTCEQVQRELTTCFGSDQVPQQVAEHLKRCGQCRELFEELAKLRRQLPSDELFHPGASDTATLATRVDSAVDGLERNVTQISSLLKQVVSVAAVVILMLGAGLSGYLLREHDTEAQQTDATSSLSYSTDWESDRYSDLDDKDVHLLLMDYTSSSGREAAENLLGDLTEEEFDYLASNFKVGDIL